MGYECGFSSYNKKLFADYKQGSNLYDYTNDIYNKIKKSIADNKSLIMQSTQMDIEEVKKIYHKNDFGSYSICKDIDYWCSIGKYITDLMVEESIIDRSNEEYYYLITKDDIIKLLCRLCDKYLNPENIKHYDILHGVTYIEDEDHYKLTPIDGVEFLNKQTGEYNRVMSGYERDDLVYIDLQDDIDNVYTSLVMCLCNMLKNIDFDKEVIVFWESY